MQFLDNNGADLLLLRQATREETFAQWRDDELWRERWVKSRDAGMWLF